MQSVTSIFNSLTVKCEVSSVLKSIRRSQSQKLTWLVAALAICMQGCVTVNHGTFGAASTRPLSESPAPLAARVSGNDCEEYVLVPSEIPHVNEALENALSNAAGADALTDVKVSFNAALSTPGSAGICTVIEGAPVRLGPVTAEAAEAEAAPMAEVSGLEILDVDLGNLTILAPDAAPLAPETLGEPVTGEDCTWTVLFIPVSKLISDPALAMDDAMEKAGPKANLLVNGQLRVENRMFVLVNSSCWQVEATPARSALIE